MSKAEKILDKVMGILFFIFLISLIVYGIFTFTYTHPTNQSAPPKEIPKKIPTKCVRCGQEDTINIFQFRDTPSPWL